MDRAGRDLDASDVQATEDASSCSAEDTEGAVPVIETADVDIREIAATEPAQRDEDLLRVPPADEVEKAVKHANRALAEIHARTDLDDREADEHRAAELARWHTEQHLHGDVAEVGDQDEPARDRYCDA